MGKAIVVNNKMQKNYTYTVENNPKDTEDFYKDFKPELTPKEMLTLGMMGGKYFNDVADTNEYPKEWFKDAKLSGIDKPYNKELNYYKVKCGSSLKQWKENGWIDKHDKRGWIEWYLRFMNNRRIPEIDKIQIVRWKNAERFIKSAVSHHKKTGTWSKALLQTALHWGYDPRKYLKMKG